MVARLYPSASTAALAAFLSRSSCAFCSSWAFCSASGAGASGGVAGASDGRTVRTKGTGFRRASRTLRLTMASEGIAGPVVVAREAAGRDVGSSSAAWENTQPHATSAARARKLFIFPSSVTGQSIPNATFATVTCGSAVWRRHTRFGRSFTHLAPSIVSTCTRTLRRLHSRSKGSAQAADVDTSAFVEGRSSSTFGLPS